MTVDFISAIGHGKLKGGVYRMATSEAGSPTGPKRNSAHLFHVFFHGKTHYFFFRSNYLNWLRSATVRKFTTWTLQGNPYKNLRENITFQNYYLIHVT